MARGSRVLRWWALLLVPTAAWSAAAAARPVVPGCTFRVFQQRLGHPSWSPTGKQIALDARGPDGNEHVVTVALTKPNRFSVVGAGTSPSWSPAGSTLAYNAYEPIPLSNPTSCGPPEQPDIFVIRPGEQSATNVTATDAVFENDPVWAPRGDAIAFLAADTSGNTIGFLDLKSHRETFARTGFQYVDALAWGPSGRKLGFTAYDGKIHVINRDGGTLSQIAPRWPFAASAPWSFNWSPDGRRIVASVFVLDGHGYNSGLFVMNADGSHVRRLTRGRDLHPTWSPDGRSIAFVRNPVPSKTGLDRQDSLRVTSPAGGTSKILLLSQRD